MGAPFADAQTSPTGTGTVQGRVYNPVSKEYVRNAEVRLEGTNQVTFTESDGSFRFDNIPAGTASLAVTYSGYNTVKESFTVTSGQPVVREINLTSTAGSTMNDGTIRLDAFTVSSEREGNSKAIMTQRSNMNITTAVASDISTAVASDIFGDVMDGNVGEFIKYLPGVDIDYQESIARAPKLGGMESQYVGVSFDGVRIASADATRGGGDGGRSASFEGFSISAVESVEISRTSSADQDGDTPAGTINMRTKRAFERKGRRISFNGAISFNADEFTLRRTRGPDDGKHYKWTPNLTLEYSEAFFNQRLGVLLSYSTANSYSEQYGVDISNNRTPTPTDPRPIVVRQINFMDGPKFHSREAFLLTTDYKVTPNLVVSLNAMYSYAGGEFHNRNFTFIAANDNTNAANGRSTITGDGLLEVRTNRSATNTVPIMNTGGFGSGTEITYSRTLSPKFEYKRGAFTIDGAAAYSRAHNNFDSLERGYAQTEGGGVPADFIATRPNPESWEWTIRQTSGPDWFDMRNVVSTDPRSGGTRVDSDGREWITEIWSGQGNLRWALPFKRFPTVLKFGGKWNEENRDNNNTTPWNIWSYTGPGGNTVAKDPVTGANINTSFGNWANVGPEYISQHQFDMGTTNALTLYNVNGVQGVPQRVARNAVADLFYAKPELFAHMGTPENFYSSFVANKRDFRQTITGVFGQADVRLTRKLQLRYGVRAEETKNALVETDPLTAKQMFENSPYSSQFTRNVNPTTGAVIYSPTRAVTLPGIQYQFFSQPRVTRESKYHNFFPSALLKYQILPNFEFQAGYNKAITRPPIDNLTGLWNVDEVNLRVNAPNPDLKPEHSRNLQSRLAYYFGGRSPGQLSVQVSQNTIKNLRETTDYTPAEFGVDDPDFAAYTFRSTRNSTEVRRFRSMELAYHQTLGFLPSELLRGINVNFAYTRAYASQRRNGLAPHRLTSRLGYSYRRFNGTLGMVWKDDVPDGAYGSYAGSLTQFDMTLNWRLTPRLTLYVQGRNISNQPILRYISPTGVEEGKDAALRQLRAYGANWVFGIKGIF